MKLHADIVSASLLLLHCSTPIIGTIENDAGSDAAPQDDVALLPIDAGTPGNVCSNDLRDVLGPDGKVVQTCPPDQGCENGVCVPACKAAAASHGSLGCDFVVSTPMPAFTVGKQPCFVAFVVNGWVADVPLHVSRGGMTFDASTIGRIADVGVAETAWAPVPKTGLPPGKVAVLYLSDDPDATWVTPITCPIPPAVRATYGTSITGTGDGCSGDACFLTGRGKSFHVTADLPITTYNMMEYAPAGASAQYGYSSASLLFPTTSWGTNYFAFMPGPGNYVPTGQVIASEDNTTITILPNTDLPSGPSVAAAKKNVVATYTLNAGDFIQWQLPMSSPAPPDMSGTIIQSSAPVSFLSGTTFMSLASKTWPAGGTAGDHKQVPAIATWGSEYAVEPFATRKPDLSPESIPYRVQAAVDGTALTFAPPIAGAPVLMQAGQTADFEAVGGFVVTSQDVSHPIHLEQIMTGRTASIDPDGGLKDSRPGCDPVKAFSQGGCMLGGFEAVNVLPPAQFLKKYVFYIDPGFATSNLVFVRKKTSLGFRDVTLDCVGVLTGWKPIGTSGQYEGMDLDLVRGAVPKGSCSAGPHTASSDGTFGVTVWGLDFGNTYAYPAGGNAAVLNTVVVPPMPK